jgi:hypothetical protein
VFLQIYVTLFSHLHLHLPNGLLYSIFPTKIRCVSHPHVTTVSPTVSTLVLPPACCLLRGTNLKRSRDSSVGIATRYGLEGPGIESRWGEIFRTIPDRLRGPPSLLYHGYRLFPGGKGGRGVMLTTHPLLVPRLRKS